MTEIIEKARQLQSELVELRRHFHKHPELGFAERETAARLTQELVAVGFNVHQSVSETTQVIADHGKGPCVAIRAEMDALPLPDLTDSSYSSLKAGISHACGHDANMSCAVGAARLVAGSEHPGCLRVIMQPATEEKDGAGVKASSATLRDSGVLDGVLALLSLHVDVTLPPGKIGVNLEPLEAPSLTFAVALSGGEKASAIAAAAMAAKRISEAFPIELLHLNLLQSEPCPAQETPKTIWLGGLIESASEAERSKACAQLQSLCDKLNSPMQQVSLQLGSLSDPGRSEEVREIIMACAAEVVGEKNIVTAKRKSWMEDLSRLCGRTPGALIVLGTEVKDERRSHHSSNFDIEESPLHIGSAVLAHSALRLLQFFCM